MSSPLPRLARTAALAATALLLPLAAPAPSPAQTIEAQVDSVANRLYDARAENLNVIAPRHFQRAVEQLTEARDRLQSGGSINDIREQLGRARESLARAEELREVGTVLLEDAIQAREEALAAGATEYAPEAWEEATAELVRAGREVEDGDQNDARDRAERARTRFREAQVTAIERSLLGQARELRERARDADAHERAPRTYGRADSLLSRAESLLRRDPTTQSRAGTLAETAVSEFRHAARIAAQADTFRRDGGVEELVLRAEEQLARVAGALDFEPRFADGLAPVTDDVLAAVRSLQEERAGLQDRLASMRQELEGSEGRVDSLRERLAQLGERQGQVTAELEERRRREQKMRDARSLFGQDEAEVLSRGNQLIVRLIGLQFASGSSEIRPEHFSLLTKVRGLLRDFPEATVTVQGHTDSRGNDELNQSLSQRRALAVHEYLLANTEIGGNRLRSEGYGESQPIASNETAEGRARNRRIDIVLTLPDTEAESNRRP